MRDLGWVAHFFCFFTQASNKRVALNVHSFFANV